MSTSASVELFPLTPATEQEVSAGLAALNNKKAEWASLPLSEKADLLETVKLRLLTVSEEWATKAVAIKGLEHNPTAAAGELVKLSFTLANHLNRLISVLRHAAKHGKCPEHKVVTLPSGQLAAKVFPVTAKDRFVDLFGVYGFQAEVWIQPGKPPSQGGTLLRGEGAAGGVAVVLAAGNHGFIGIMDALEQLVVFNRVVALKYHDVLADLTGCLEYFLAPLRERGYLWGVQADLKVAQALLYHPLTTHVHITGGNATHDVIVWGPPGEEREARIKGNTPLLKAPISSELGNISPWLVTPGGPWTDAQLDHHAKALAEAVADNSSANCLAAKVVLLSDSWEHTDDFVSRLKAALRSMPSLPSYYPGTQQRAAEFLKHHPQADLIHGETPGRAGTLDAVPVALLELDGVPGKLAGQHCLSVEPFAPALTIIRVPSANPEEFLQAAVPLCNDNIWGSLCCTLLVHPNAERANRAAVEKAIADLRYGTVSINAWPANAFSSEVAHWGGFQGPGQTYAAPQSGIGTAHNCYMYDFPQKTVFRTPFISGLHLMPKHIHPLPMQLPLSLSATWVRRLARIFAGFLVDGLRGISRMLLFSSPSARYFSG